MKSLTSTLGHYPRLALLLFMLAAQGIAGVHELGDSHALESDLCATCIVGHGLGAAVTVSYDAPQLQIYHALIVIVAITSAAVARTYSNIARAPPASF
jgi:hypothetical protein